MCPEANKRQGSICWAQRVVWTVCNGGKGESPLGTELMTKCSLKEVPFEPRAWKNVSYIAGKKWWGAETGHSRGKESISDYTEEVRRGPDG